MISMNLGSRKKEINKDSELYMLLRGQDPKFGLTNDECAQIARDLVMRKELFPLAAHWETILRVLELSDTRGVSFPADFHKQVIEQLFDKGDASVTFNSEEGPSGFCSLLTYLNNENQTYLIEKMKSRNLLGNLFKDTKEFNSQFKSFAVMNSHSSLSDKNRSMIHLEIRLANTKIESRFFDSSNKNPPVASSSSEPTDASSPKPK